MPSSDSHIARKYLQAIESGATGEALGQFLADDIQYEELPNRLFPNGRRSNRSQMLESDVKGQQVLSSQSYEALNIVSLGDSVALEVRWSGTLKIAFGDLPVGRQLRDRSAIFLEFRNGRIARQRNYDCYDPW